MQQCFDTVQDSLYSTLLYWIRCSKIKFCCLLPWMWGRYYLEWVHKRTTKMAWKIYTVKESWRDFLYKVWRKLRWIHNIVQTLKRQWILSITKKGIGSPLLEVFKWKLENHHISVDLQIYTNFLAFLQFYNSQLNESLEKLSLSFLGEIFV